MITKTPWKFKDDEGMFLSEKSKWSADFDGRPAGGVATNFPIIAANGQTVALIVYEGNDSSRADANARLIIAADDLLEALKPFARFACSPPGECECNNCKARDAVSKAELKEFIFYRINGFYFLTIPENSVAENAEANPGTIRVENAITREVIWTRQ